MDLFSYDGLIDEVYTVRDTWHTRQSSHQPSRQSLPPEIWLIIIYQSRHLDKASLRSLASTSKFLYINTTRVLYHDLFVHAFFAASIPKLIRTLDPFLSVRQKQGLRQTTLKYKGIKYDFPAGDKERRPMKASYVQRFELGECDLRSKHMPTILQYVEECLGNLVNLRELIWMDLPISDTLQMLLPRFTKLSRLSITFIESRKTLQPLAISNLTYLHIQFECMNAWGSPDPRSIYNSTLFHTRYLLEGSQATLKELHLAQVGWNHIFIPQLFGDISSVSSIPRYNYNSPYTGNNSQLLFPSLETFAITGCILTEHEVSTLASSFEFNRLKTFEIGNVMGTNHHLFASSAWSTSLNLTSCFINAATAYEDVENNALDTWLCSFSSLRELTIFSSCRRDCPAWLVSAIITHTGLRKLDMRRSQASDKSKAPCTIRHFQLTRLLKQLPLLQELGMLFSREVTFDSYDDYFAPFLYATALVHLKTDCFAGYVLDPSPQGGSFGGDAFSRVTKMMEILLAAPDSKTGEWRWSDHCSLRTIDTDGITYTLHDNPQPAPADDGVRRRGMFEVVRVVESMGGRRVRVEARANIDQSETKRKGYYSTGGRAQWYK